LPSTHIYRSSARADSYGDADQTRRVRAGSREYTYTQLGLTGEKQSQARTFFVRDPEGTLLYQRTPSGTHYMIPDGLGSTVGLVNASGARVATYDFEPYGELTVATGSASTPFRFASGYFDTSWGATKFGTRYYQPGVARWTQHDPERGQLTNPLSLNPYLYVGCNPVNATDPSGRQCTGFEWLAMAMGIQLAGEALVEVASLLFAAGWLISGIIVGWLGLALIGFFVWYLASGCPE
jgi:RHS repeat-associated protein